MPHQPSTTAPIRFYGTNHPFSNFHLAPFTAGKKSWPTVEHFFQAMKTIDPKLREAVRKARKPGDAKKLGRQIPLRPGWNGMRDEVMSYALRAKFTQNPALQRALCATDGRKLIEASPRDAYWGEGPRGTGKNRLGTLLMELRSELCR